jgi:hypothetical protein
MQEIRSIIANRYETSGCSLFFPSAMAPNRRRVARLGADEKLTPFVELESDQIRQDFVGETRFG